MARNPKTSDLPFIGISEAISQTESKRLPQTIPVLEYILKNKTFSAKQLAESLDVSRDSIDNTIEILQQKQLIELKEKKARGEIFYQLKSNLKLRVYKEKLMKWWYSKIFIKSMFKTNLPKGATKLKKTLQLNTKRAMYSSLTMSGSDEKKYLYFVSYKSQQRITKTPYPDPIIIWDLPYSEADRIVQGYSRGLLCEVCFGENKISFLTRHSGEEVCEVGHATISQSNDEFSEQSYPLTRKKSKSITDYELKTQKRNYLGKARNPKKRHFMEY